MLTPYHDILSWYSKSLNVLEPSAWSWAIIDYISEIQRSRENVKVFAIEQNIELQNLLRWKHYKVIDTDFLNYSKDLEFDLIVMNPPFSNGDEHFLKAWEIWENTDIVCLLNAETIRNPYSEKRKLVNRIIEDNWGSIEYIKNAFSEADRKTDIEIALVRVTKKTENARFSFEGFTTEKIEMNEEILQNELVTRDIVQNIIDDYKRSRDMFAEWMKLIEKSSMIASSITDNYWLKPFEIASQGWSLNDRYTAFVDSMKYGIWRKIATQLNIEKYMTSKLQSDFRSYIKDQWSLAITHENIRAFADMVFQNRYNILDNAIVEVFDEFTKYHQDNRVYIEGWKTNDSWKVNRKVILPYWIKYEKNWYRGSNGFDINYSYTSKMQDIDKALAYITGRSYETLRTIEKALEDSFKQWGEGKAESTFFEIRYFKKGTVHITFKDEEIWKEFNMRACAGKNWLPKAEEDSWKKSKQSKETGIIIF